MAYLVLARKYRPQRFGEMSGQAHVVRTLSNALERGQLAHAFLFTGPRGVGKTTAARLVAKAVNCEKGPTAEPCGDCVPLRGDRRGAGAWTWSRSTPPPTTASTTSATSSRR